MLDARGFPSTTNSTFSFLTSFRLARSKQKLIVSPKLMLINISMGKSYQDIYTMNHIKKRLPWQYYVMGQDYLHGSQSFSSSPFPCQSSASYMEALEMHTN